jgi:uncharacterized protein YggE
VLRTPAQQRVARFPAIASRGFADVASIEQKRRSPFMATSILAATLPFPPAWRRCRSGTAALAAAVVLAIVPAHAQQPQSPAEARVVVTGEGSVSVPPDHATIGGGVTTRAKTAKEAADANAKLMATVMAALLDAGIAQKDIKTTQFSIQPVYAAPEPRAEPKLTGYGVSNQVNVSIREIAKTGEILDRLVTAGATDVGSIVFSVADPAAALDRAREAAVADARRKAELYARAAGLPLGRVAWITEDLGYEPLVPMGALHAAAARAKATPISTGEDTLHARITVGFDIAR